MQVLLFNLSVLVVVAITIAAAAAVVAVVVNAAIFASIVLQSESVFAQFQLHTKSKFSYTHRTLNNLHYHIPSNQRTESLFNFGYISRINEHTAYSCLFVYVM